MLKLFINGAMGALMRKIYKFSLCLNLRNLELKLLANARVVGGIMGNA